MIKRNPVSLAIGTVFGSLAVLGAHSASESPDEPLLAAANSGVLAGVLIGKNLMDVRKGPVSLNGGVVIIMSMAMCARYSNNIYTGMSRPPTGVQK